MRHRGIVALLLAAVCLFAACGDDDTPTAPEEPQGHWVEKTIGNWQYQNNRFFRLDLPPYLNHEALGYQQADSPGRDPANEFIDPTSIRIYRSRGSGPAQAQDIAYAAATIDSSGRWSEAYLEGVAPDDWHPAWTWRPIDLSLLRDVNGGIVAVDLRRELLHDDVLAMVYTVVDNQGNLLYTVGDHPDLGAERGLDINGQGYYRFKLLKPESRDPYTFQYVLRNIYSLGFTNIDPTGFEFSIEYADVSVTHPDLHGTMGLSYLRLFGLDREDEQGEQIPDGQPDLHRNALFDLEKGLLKFPLDFPFPFAADEEIYREYAMAEPGQWEWDETDLERSIASSVEFYDWMTRPQDYPQYGRFNIVVRHWFWGPDPADLPAPDRVSLERLAWAPASLPEHAWVDHADRANDIRWFAPSTPVVRRWLDPGLEIPARDETVPALEMAINPRGESWAWAGAMTGLDRVGLDLTKVDRLEIWINDFAQFPGSRRGTLHVDLGSIDEDFQWRTVDGEVEYGTFQHEDRNRDGIFSVPEEDVGLDAVIDPQTNELILPGVDYDADPGTAGDPYPHINATANNNHEDSEDLNGDTSFNTENRYLTWAIDLAGDDAEVDVAIDHPDADLQGTAWRKYVLPLADGGEVSKFETDFLERFTHLRIWIDNADGSAARRYQIAEVRFQ